MNSKVRYSRLHVTFEWHCLRCNSIARRGMQVFEGDDVPVMPLPDDWRQIDLTYGMVGFVCPRHEVKTTVDGEEL
jgi:hypothetical protein